MFCAKWVSGDPSTIEFPESVITNAGFSLGNYDEGISFIFVGAGISSLHAYPDPDMTGDALEVKRNTVYDFKDHKKREDLDKKIRSFDIVFGGSVTRMRSR